MEEEEEGEEEVVLHLITATAVPLLGNYTVLDTG